MGKTDKKGGDKAASKGKAGDKEAGGAKAKGAQSINVRHILVSRQTRQCPSASKQDAF